MEAVAPLPNRLLVSFLATLQLPIVLLLLVAPESFAGCCLVMAGWLLIFSLSRHFDKVMFLLLLLVAWFPEFSQTEDAWSAEDFKSLYNYKPIASLTASVFDYLFIVIVALWLIRVAWPRRREILSLPLVKEMLYFLGISAFGLVFGLMKGYSAYYALREFRVSAYFVLAFLMWVTTVDTDRKFRQAVQVIAGAAFIVGIYGVLRYALGLGKVYYDTLLVYYDIADSMILYLGLFVIVCMWYSKKSNIVLSIALAAPMIFSLLLSYRRGAWIACGAGLLLLFVLHPSAIMPHKKPARRWLIWLIPALLVCTVAVVLTAVNNSELFIERAQSIVDT
ncbi:MAG: hypothetical protein ACRD3Q_05695, partial [Terriglobales bacterium]